uniref:Uncharacterized protein n=1 Tax=Megaselia scalaris TaxID=36166 RepID=T1GEA8_MEGSC
MQEFIDSVFCTEFVIDGNSEIKLGNGYYDPGSKYFYLCTLKLKELYFIPLERNEVLLVYLFIKVSLNSSLGSSISGFVVFGVAVWTLFWKFKYVCLMTTPTYSFGVYGFGIAGALAIFGGFLGCCGIYYEKRVVICMNNRLN